MRVRCPFVRIARGTECDERALGTAYSAWTRARRPDDLPQRFSAVRCPTHDRENDPAVVRRIRQRLDRMPALFPDRAPRRLCLRPPSQSAHSGAAALDDPLLLFG